MPPPSLLRRSPETRGGRRPFLARPFWRDYVLAYVVIALGFMLTSPNSPIHPVVGMTIGGAGLFILACAIGWSLVTKLRRRAELRNEAHAGGR